MRLPKRTVPPRRARRSRMIPFVQLGSLDYGGVTCSELLLIRP